MTSDSRAGSLKSPILVHLFFFLLEVEDTLMFHPSYPFQGDRGLSQGSMVHLDRSQAVAGLTHRDRQPVTLTSMGNVELPITAFIHMSV